MSHKPQTAFDYRRYILLVQALAEFSVESELRAVLIQLVKAWQLPLRDDAPYSWLETVPTIQIVQLLAQSIVRYRSNEEPQQIIYGKSHIQDVLDTIREYERLTDIEWKRIQQDALHSWDG